MCPVFQLYDKILCSNIHQTKCEEKSIFSGLVEQTWQRVGKEQTALTTPHDSELNRRCENIDGRCGVCGMVGVAAVVIVVGVERGWRAVGDCWLSFTPPHTPPCLLDRCNAPSKCEVLVAWPASARDGTRYCQERDGRTTEVCIVDAGYLYSKGHVLRSGNIKIYSPLRC